MKPVTRYVEYFLVTNYKGTVTQKMKGRERVPSLQEGADWIYAICTMGSRQTLLTHTGIIVYAQVQWTSPDGWAMPITEICRADIQGW